jgi:hypothetical protein
MTGQLGAFIREIAKRSDGWRYGEEGRPMSIGPALIDALKSFASIEQDLIALGKRADATTANDFVRVRRQLVMAFAEVSAAFEKDPWLIAEAHLMHQAQRLLAAFRSQNAINQANWPVVRVRDNLAEYQIAARPVGERSRDFWDWLAFELRFERERVSG